MQRLIEDYALIGDCHTGALVSRTGSIDWLCLPRFDSGACFAALLGNHENGHWQIRPQGEIQSQSRTYRGNTLVLETEFRTPTGTVAVIDFMATETDAVDVVRIVEGRSGNVVMETELILRLDYGLVVPWVRKIDGRRIAMAGPDALLLQSDVELHGENMHTVGKFAVAAGERKSFVLTWFPSHREFPPYSEPGKALEATEKWWAEWSQRCTYDGPYRSAVMRSLLTLKALTYQPTGGIIAALTTSLPECLGGNRNWDYRYCWLRDATFTLYALLGAGYTDEAIAWRNWLMRAVAGKPESIQPLYGVAGERWLPELEIEWLAGYAHSKPVRIGNGAHTQLQIDVYGELMAAIELSRRSGIEPEKHIWSLQRALLKHLETVWQQPDKGIWEMRGAPRHFTHSKVMAWVAMSRAIRSAEHNQLPGPVDHWRKLRDQMHADICQQGFHSKLNSFTQSYGSTELDASLLLIPLLGFLPAEDPRVRGTVEAIEKNLTHDGFVRRYIPQQHIDGMSGDEGTFLMCSFWLADAKAMLGQREEAHELFRRLLDLRNDVGLLAEQYDPAAKRFLGNFPQAFSHVSLVNTARNLTDESGPAEQRSQG